ncbi:MAG: oligosaccharide flippase family protein [Parcubacteria group bacterium]
MRINSFTNLRALLLDNKTTKQTIFKNTFWVALASAIGDFSKFILIIYVTRILGATEFGKFAFALSFISLFFIFNNFGLSSIVTREFSRGEEKEKDFSSIISLRILLGLGATALILIGSFFITPDPIIRKVIWVLAVFSQISNFSLIIYAFFGARQKMEYESWSIILEAATVTAVGFFVIFNFPSILNLSYSYLLSVVFSLILALTLLHFKVFRLRISWNVSVWKKYLAMSWPLGLISLFSIIYISIDSVMLGYLGKITENGWYSAAYKMALFTTMPMGIIATSFFPVLSKFFEESKEKFQTVWDYYMEIIISLAIPLVAGGILLAPRIIDFLYGKNFYPSVLAFQILMIMAGIIFFSKPFTQILVASNQQKKVFWITLMGALTNIVLNLILIPRYSLYGAAVATVITYFLMLFLLFSFILKFTSLQLLNLRLFFSFIIISFSTAVMSFTISRPQIYNLNIFFSIIIGTTVYFIALYFLEKILRRLGLKTFNLYESR